MLTKGEKYPVLDHGHVIYVDHMGDDMDIVDAARVSYDGKGKSSDRDLLRYLMRNRHTSPFEMCEIKIIVKCPIFVARQWVRHRTASMNEVSARYTQLPKENYLPKHEDINIQSTDNKQGRGQGKVAAQDEFYFSALDTYDVYERLLDQGVARELSRAVLPLSTYTEFVWKINLHNLMHFLNLRLDQHAQYEIRVYAEAIKELAMRLWPVTMEAFFDYMRDGVHLSRFEKDLLIYLSHRGGGIDEVLLIDLKKKYVQGGAMTEREWNEFVTKFRLDAKINAESENEK